MHFVSILLLLVNLITNIKAKNCDIKLCNDAKNIDLCIQAHECCVYCYDPKYMGTRCNLEEILTNDTNCSRDQIELNFGNKVEKLRDEDFTINLEPEKIEYVIQMRPQHLSVKLRKGTPINITFSYKAVKNYPLDLYYLMDQSYSMERHLNQMKKIGGTLSDMMSDITSNYRVAFGSFLDKVAMPFYPTDDLHKNNPCGDHSDISKPDAHRGSCDPGYSFIHRLNFTNNGEVITKKINKTVMTANLDDLDGALDALMQLLVCKEEVGWADYARKLIVVPTDSYLHMAGDGILVGSVKPNDEKCHLDHTGNLVNALEIDYPSLHQINTQLKKKKVNLIFAIKAEKLEVIEYYQELKNILKNIYIGNLTEDNIKKLVEDGYNTFAKEVDFFVNNPNYLSAKFFADCNGNGIFKETSGCTNVRQGEEIQFHLQLELVDTPPDDALDKLIIEERNIKENIHINMEYVGFKGYCKNYVGKENKCVNGTAKCGECVCREGWEGELCENECIDNDKPCRLGETITCSNRGDCRCGKCTCDRPYVGTYCQFECPHNNKHEICSNHGTCETGTCTCEKDYIGPKCDCWNSTTNCIAGGDINICSAHGYCECNRCKCEEGYKGRYCQFCSSCNDLEKDQLCNVYQIPVAKFYEDNQFKEKDTIELNGTIYDITRINDTDNLGSSQCRYIYENDEGRSCSITFSYTQISKSNNNVEIITKKPVCGLTTLQSGMLMGVMPLAIVFLTGLITLIIWKYVVTKRDEREYAKFENEQKFKSTEMNPLYKKCTTEYDVSEFTKNLR